MQVRCLYLCVVLAFGSLARSFSDHGPTVVAADGSRECAAVEPSASYPFINTNRRSPNTGVVAPGFIHPLALSAVSDGIEVSKYQSNVDFVEAQRCGAQFALVRLTAGIVPGNETTYREHWRNAKSVGLFVAPYHNLTFMPAGAARYASMPSEQKPAELERLLLAARHSHAQSDLFLTRLKELIESDPSELLDGRRGRTFLDPVVDMTYDPLAKAPLSVRESYGPVVQALACNFIKQNKADAELNISRVVIYVTPSIWHDYHLAEADCDLAQDGIMLSFMTRDGGAVDSTGTFKDICVVDQVNRCVFDHYTTLASFLDFNEDQAVSLLRFYGTRDQLKERLNVLP